MTLAKKQEKMAQVRLGAVLENLHKIASDPGTPEDEALTAATQLGRTVLEHMDKIILALKAA